jgi:alanine racemase
VVDVTEVEDVELGDEVVIFGKQGDATITLSEHAEWMGEIPLIAVTVLGRTNPHIYFRNGKPVSDHRNALLEAGLRPLSS